jgi:hypothetical protein
MGKLLLLLITPTAIGLSMLLLGSARDAIGSADSTLNRRSDVVVAREVALSGLADAESTLLPAVSQVAIYDGQRDFAAAVGAGTYVTVIHTAGPVHTITSIGTVNGQTATIRRVYRAEYVPAFMGMAVVTENNIVLHSPLTVRAESPDINASVWTNHNFEVNGGPISVEGYAFHAGVLGLHTGVPASQMFMPVSNPDNAPVSQVVAPMVIPPIVPSAYALFATRQTLGDLRLSGDVMLGTRENPTIWYVDGALDTSADVTLHGYGIFLVNNEVRFTHNVRSANMGESNAAFYSGGHIKVMSGALDIAGQLFANGNVELKENTNLVGSLVARNVLNTLGPVTITYRPPTAALTNPFWPQVVGGIVNPTAVPAGLRVESYREW